MFRAILRFILLTAILSLAVMVAGAWFWPQFIKKEQLVDFLNRNVFELNEQKLVVQGDAAFSLLPSISLTFQKFTLIKEDGTNQAMFDGDRIRLAQDVLSALRGKLSLEIEYENNGRRVVVDLRTDQLEQLRNRQPAEVTLLLSKSLDAELDALLTLTPEKIDLNNGLLRVGQHTNGRVNLTIYPSPEVSSYTADLQFEKLDTRGLQALAAPFALAGENAKQAAAYQENPRPESFWRNDPLPFEVLRTVNADVKLSAKEATIEGVKLANLDARLALDKGKLTLELKPLSLYGGVVESKLSVDASGEQAVIRQTKTIRDLALGQYLMDAGIYGKFQGNISGTSDLQTYGDSEMSMIEHLNGAVTLTLHDGQWMGVDLLKLAEANPNKLRLDALIQEQEGSSTKIDLLTAGLNIKDGVATNKDLTIKLPLSELNGEGELNLKNLRVDYRLTPIIGVQQIGIRVPVAITGDVRNPLILPDIRGLVTQGLDSTVLEQKEVKKITEGLEKLRDTVAKDAPMRLIEGLAPGIMPAAPEAEAPGEPTMPATEAPGTGQ